MTARHMTSNDALKQGDRIVSDDGVVHLVEGVNERESIFTLLCEHTQGRGLPAWRVWYLCFDQSATDVAVTCMSCIAMEGDSDGADGVDGVDGVE